MTITQGIATITDHCRYHQTISGAASAISTTPSSPLPSLLSAPAALPRRHPYTLSLFTIPSPHKPPLSLPLGSPRHHIGSTTAIATTSALAATTTPVFITTDTIQDESQTL